ncbi:thermonuclease family protein [Candidatus Falkowbacteria bacterium]|nr:thermonuclease family protein [Candidatus Falkowbacteria bacterium]
MIKKISIIFLFVLVLSGCDSSVDLTNDYVRQENPSVPQGEATVQTDPVQQDLANTEQESKPPEPTTKTPEPIIETYLVVKVIDGDTISVSINGVNESVRLIGLDTPETVHPSKPVECFGKEASNMAKELLTNQRVKLESELTQPERDKYGRLLYYVYREDGLFFNKWMIENGYAHEYTYNIPYKYQTEFKQAENYARNNKLGLWADGICDVDIDITPELDLTPVPQGEYDCLSNKYNCGDFKTHDEAQAVYEFCGGVDNDIHRLDSDGDGDACESLN